MKIKKIKHRIGIFCTAFVLILVQIGSLTTYAETKSDCTTWKLTSSDEWTEGSDVVKSLDKVGYDAVTSGNKSIKYSNSYGANINNSSELGVATSSDTMKDKGSQIYSLMKLIILSGVDAEYSSGKGLNPNVFYWDLALATNESTFSYTTTLSYNDSSSYYSKYLAVRYPDITMANHKTFGTSETYTSDAKSSEIQAEMDNKHWIIVKTSADIYVLLTGYREDGSTITFLMEDNYSSEEIFSKNYKLTDVTEYYAFEVSGNHQSKVDFYNQGAEIPWNLILVNKTHEVSEEYIESVDTSTTNYIKAAASKDEHNDYSRNEVDARVVDDIDALAKAYNEDTGKTISCQSGMRSYAYQQYLFQDRYGGGTEAETYSARPGKSEHNVGLAMDFNSEGHGADSSFAGTPGYTWLKKHAFEYGFIWRYPAISDCVEKTGYITEEWHWRYIGKEWARKYIEYIGGTIETDENGNEYTDVFDNGDYNGKVYENFYEDVVVPYFAGSTSDATTATDEDEDDLTIGYCDHEYIDAPVKRIEYFFKHPIVSLSNMTVSICQTVHNSVGAGGTGDIFGMNYYISKATTTYVIKFYMIFATIVFFFAVVYKGYLYIWGKVRTLGGLALECYNVLKVTALPLICLLALAWGLSKINSWALSDWYASLIAIETQGITQITASDTTEANQIDSEQTASVDESGSLTVSDTSSDLAVSQTNTYYMTDSWLDDNLFIEVLDEDSYNNIQIKMPKSYTKDTLSYYSIDLSTLYQTVKADTTIEQLDDTNYQYYNCDEFVPVHKSDYNESVFYYFYDYIKYQYLAYYKTTKTWTGDYVNPGVDFNLNPLFEYYSLTSDDDLTSKIDEITSSEDLSSYKSRMKYLEDTYFNSSKRGYYKMYTNKNYAYTDNYINGEQISEERYTNDLIGLSSLFDLTDARVDCDDYTTMSEWIEAYKEVENEVTFEDWRDGASLLKENSIAYFADSDFFDYYTTKSKISTSYNGLDTLKYYQFVPSVINSKFSTYDNTRVQGRVYASYGRLLYDTYNSEDYSKISQPTSLEKKLISINENYYEDAYEFLTSAPSDLNDETICFTLAIIATIDFNKEMGNLYPNDIDTEFIDIDKVFRLMYTSTVSDITDNEQVYYMIYNKTNAVNILILTYTEVLMLIYNGCRLVLILFIVLSSVWLAISYCAHKAESVEASIKGILLQTSCLFVLNLACIGTLKLSVWLNNLTTEKWLQITYSILLFIMFFMVTLITVIFTVAMLKDFRTYGYNVLAGVIQNAKNVYNNTIMSLEEQANLKVDDVDIKHNAKPVNSAKIERRRFNLRIFNDDDEED